MIRFGICDDELEFSDSLAMEIPELYRNNCNVADDIKVYTYLSGAELLNRYKEDKPDIVFMDIELGDDSGFKIADRLRDISDNTGIVYITNHETYMKDAFVCRPLGFIRKDNLENDFLRAAGEINRFLAGRKEKILFRDGVKEVPVSLDDIIMVEVYDHDVVIVREGGNIQVKDKLKRVEDELLNHDFVKVARGRMIRLKYISKIDKGECCLYNGDRYAISDSRISEIKESLLKYKMR